MKRFLMTNTGLNAEVGHIYYSDDTTSFDRLPDKTPIGVVLDTNLHIVVGLTPLIDLNWYKDNSDYSFVDGCKCTDSDVIAQTFFDGPKETDLIFAKLGANAYGAAYCKNYGVAGKRWYMGAAGEYYLLRDNMDLINSQISKCGGTPFPNNTANGYCIWTTTQSEIYKYAAYRFFTNERKLYLGNKYHAPVKHQQARPLFRY